MDAGDATRKFIQTEIPEPEVVVAWTGRKLLPKILVLYTGGTLGMKYKQVAGSDEPALVPELSLEELLEKCDAVCNIRSRYNILGYHISHIDSTEINPQVWKNVAKVIHENYESIDGVVVLHGTDTMAYSAAATAFALQNIAIPVVFTGAQMILEADGTDVISNMTGSLAVAKSKLSEVVLYFAGSIYKGTRVEKLHDSWLQGFGSPIHGPIGHVGAHGVELGPYAVLRGKHTPSDLRYHPDFETSVLEAVIAPGLSPKVLEAAVEQADCQALLIRSYGPGNVPPWFYDFIARKTSEGYPIFISSQCAASGISPGGSEYAVGKGAVRAGAVPIGDMTPVAAAVKLMSILSRYTDLRLIQKEMVEKSYAGEITLNGAM